MSQPTRVSPWPKKRLDRHLRNFGLITQTRYSSWTANCKADVYCFRHLSLWIENESKGYFMGAGVTPKFILVFAFALAALSHGAQAQTSAGTHSPHGNLATPCQNCHTPSGWKPIRAVPEFDHNQTRYPLRGMHTSVTCTQCHVKMVFSNVGQRCQDCHADI